MLKRQDVRIDGDVALVDGLDLDLQRVRFAGIHAPAGLDVVPDDVGVQTDVDRAARGVRVDALGPHGACIRVEDRVDDR